MRFFLISILVISAILRIGWLSRGDTVTDEVLYAFRAVGPMDFDEGEDQTTPLEWFDERGVGDRAGIPWWTSLSFHDHPPLVFWIQHLSMRVFGETNFGFRFPSALLGIGSVYLLYLIGYALYSKTVGLAASALLAVTVNHVYISRIGLQEAYVIFFLLLMSYSFLRSLEKDTYLLLAGIVLGLALLTKYTALVLAPIFLVYLLLFKRGYFLNKKLWIGMILAVAIFSPVIIYNYKLYRRVGHFDFQFSYIFGQNPDIWKVAPGKEIGTLGERVQRFLPTLIETNSWLFLALFGSAVLAFFISFFKNPLKTFREHALLIILFMFLILLLLRIGPSYRFLSMLTPFVALSIGVFWQAFTVWHRKTAVTLVALVLAFELLYSVNSQILYFPKGPKIFAYSSAVRSENYNFGYNELQKYLYNELRGKMPTAAFNVKYKFLEDLQQTAVDSALAKKYIPYHTIIIYDGNVQSMAQLWVLDRLNMYHAWPVIKTEQYLQYMSANQYSDITKAGFGSYYFIIPAENMPQKKSNHLTLVGKEFENQLVARGLKPVSIKNKRNEEAFRVYKF